MNTRYHYIVMSQQDLLENEVIEELLREKSYYYISQNKNPDLWILISPNFLNNKEIQEKLKKSSFYKQYKNKIVVSNQNKESEYYGCIVSSNEDYIGWLKLRIGDFEEINNLRNIEKTYKVNGLYGVTENGNILKSNPEKIHQELIKKKFIEFLNNIH